MNYSELKTMKITDLRHAEYNPRKISDTALAGLKESIRRFGLTQPIVWNRRTKRVVSGHQRLKALKELGEKKVPVIVVDWPELTEKEANITFNNRAIEGEFTDDIVEMLKMIEEKDKEAFEALLLNEIPLIFKSEFETTDKDDVAPEPPAVPKTKAGDLYRLGEHRLLCGDSLLSAHVSRLLGENRADMVFTDPPYNIDYKGRSTGMKIQNDKMSDKKFQQFLEDAFDSYHLATKKGSSLYVFHNYKAQSIFQNALEKRGFEITSQIVWAKNVFSMGSRYRSQHELCFYVHHKDSSGPWFGDKAQTTLWHENKPHSNHLHPTMKPVELVLRAIQNSSKAGDLVLDLFGGAGSTLIAAEKSGRKCAMMELDARYCDVIVQRWEEFTGQKAKLT